MSPSSAKGAGGRGRQVLICTWVRDCASGAFDCPEEEEAGGGSMTGRLFSPAIVSSAGAGAEEGVSKLGDSPGLECRPYSPGAVPVRSCIMAWCPGYTPRALLFPPLWLARAIRSSALLTSPRAFRLACPTRLTEGDSVIASSGCERLFSEERE